MQLNFKNCVEPIPFIILFCFALSDSTISDLIILKTCDFHKLGENCSVMYKNSSSNEAEKLRNITQPYTALIIGSKSFIETGFPMILCFLLGPWSDKNGRKPVFILPFVGSIIYYSLYAILANVPNINPYFFLIGSLISGVMGGFPAILLLSFCYVADVSERENRAWRLVFLDFSLFAGQLTGFLVGPVIFSKFDHSVVLAVSALACCFGLLYSFFLKETIHPENRGSFFSICNFSVVKDLYKFLSQKRKEFNRVIFFICLIIIALHDDMMQGTATIMYLFTSKKFGWSIAEFSNYSSIQLLATMFGMIFLAKVIAPILKLPETTCIIIASISHCFGSITKAFAKEPWHMYLSTGIGLFVLAPASLVRSIVSKTVEPKEMGQAFAVTMLMEKLGPLISTPAFVYLYTNFIDHYPCPVWFVPAAMSVVIIFLAIAVELTTRRFMRNRLFS